MSLSPVSPVSSAASPVAVTNDERRSNLIELFVKACKRAGRNALYAAVARAVFGLLKVLVKRRFDHFLKRLADEVITLNPLKWGALVGSFAFFKPLRSAIVQLLPPSTPGRAFIASAAAGAVVSQSVRVMEVSTRTELALYLAARAMHSFGSAHVLPRLPPPLRDFEHYDVIAMGIAGAQLLYAIVFSPMSHSAAYMDFLQRCTQMTKEEVACMAAYHRHQITPAVVETFAKRNLPFDPTVIDRFHTQCSLYHADPHSGCVRNGYQWAVRNFFGFALPMYAPLKISTTIAFGGHKAFAKRPLHATWKLISSILKSSAFLTVYCGGPLVAICTTSQLGIKGGWKVGVLAGALCSLATFLEPKSRRQDLALYCAMHALRSWWLTLYHRGYVPRPTARLVMQLYVVAVTWLLHQVTTEPSTIAPKFRNVLEFATR
jgi:hypothetical protein